MTVHFKPLWAKNCPKFGIAHALALGLAPWLAAEVNVSCITVCALVYLSPAPALCQASIVAMQVPHLVSTGALKAAV